MQQHQPRFDELVAFQVEGAASPIPQQKIAKLATNVHIPITINKSSSVHLAELYGNEEQQRTRTT